MYVRKEYSGIYYALLQRKKSELEKLANSESTTENRKRILRELGVAHIRIGIREDVPIESKRVSGYNFACAVGRTLREVRKYLERYSEEFAHDENWKNVVQL